MKYTRKQANARLFGNKILCVVGSFSIFASILTPSIILTALLMLLGVLAIAIGLIGVVVDTTNRTIYKIAEEIREDGDVQMFMLQDIIISLDAIQTKLEKQ